MKKTLSLIAVFSAITGIAFIAGCNKQNTVEVGDTVSISYVASFADGTVFQEKKVDDSVTFIVGNNEVIKGLDNGVIGLKLNDTQTINVQPEDGYAKDSKPGLVQKISTTIFKKLNIEPKAGERQKLGDIEGTIKGVEKDKKGYEVVLFDINPRETYEPLTYKITIEKLEKAAPKK